MKDGWCEVRKHFPISKWYLVLVAYLLVLKGESFKILPMHKNFVFPKNKKKKEKDKSKLKLKQGWHDHFLLLI
jgi:hypothetical protein